MKAPQIVRPDARLPDLAAPPSGWARDLGRHLRALRRFAGLSQEQLAALAGVSQPAVSRLERGKVAKQVVLVLRVARVITRAVARLDATALRDEPRALLAGLDTLGVGLELDACVSRDTGLEELVHAYRDASASQRRGMLASVRGWRASPRDDGFPARPTR
ncbi:MAG TPA: helix-turn-helix transcriptional regulator [Candidatus Binatia bacterium]|nr:helix-turn-helix transcriptional regulator [Candidatus Binatia bacterium]